MSPRSSGSSEARSPRSTDELRVLRERPRRRVLTAVGSAAAAAAVIAGVVALAASNPGGNAKSSSTASLTVPQQGVKSPARHSTNARLQSVEFGDVSNPSALGAEIEARLALAATPPNAIEVPAPTISGPAGGTGANGGIAPNGVTGAGTGSGPQGATGPVGATGLVGPSPTGPTGALTFELAGPAGVTGPQARLGSIADRSGHGDEGLVGAKGATGPSTRYSSNKSADDRIAPRAHAVAAEPVCAAAIRRRVGLTSAPVLTGTGTDAGLPAVVAVFAHEHGHGYVAYVLSASNCSLLSQQTLP